MPGLRRAVALLLLILPGRGLGQLIPENQTYAPTDLGERLVAYAKDLEAFNFSGAFLAAKDGQIVAAAAFGPADLEGAKPNTPDTRFEIASITKPFTAAAILRLAQDGKLSLSDPIAKHLPPIPEDCQTITIEHLLRHTSGIPGTNARGSGDDIAAVLPTFLEGGPKHEPGEKFEYWNQGYAILAAIISGVSGQSYTDYCREHLFKPAGMAATLFTGDPRPEGATVAIGRTSKGRPRSALAPPYGDYGYQYRGMGGIVSTVWDLYRWDRALRGDSILNAESKRLHFRPGPGDYALGWSVKADRKGRMVQSHSGGVRGFVGEFRRYPESDACLIVLCNRDTAPLGRLVQGLETILFGGIPSGGPPLRGLDPALADAIAGFYTGPDGRALKITAEGVVTRAELHTREAPRPILGALRRDEKDQVFFDDGIERTPLSVQRPEGKAVEAIKFPDAEFKRAEEPDAPGSVIRT